jgi:hypothetical protein
MYVRSRTCGNKVRVSNMLEFFAFLYKVCQLNAFQGDCVRSFAFCLKSLTDLHKHGYVVCSLKAEESNIFLYQAYNAHFT